MRKFNKRESVDTNLRLQIEAHFEYKWKNDKNYAFEDDNDKKIFLELPRDVQIYLYRSFLYCDFLKCFRRFFSIPNKTSKNWPAFYNWENEYYQTFMLDILQNLEPRFEDKNVVLINELEEFNEVFFFNLGTYEIGFEINHKEYYVLRYKNSNCIGAYGATFNVRALFKYKTFSQC